MKLQVLEHTIFKLHPVVAEAVAYNKKISAYRDTIFEIESYSEAEDNHLQVNFLSPKPKNMTTWFVPAHQVKLLETDEELTVSRSVSSASFAVSNSEWIWPMTGTSMGSVTEFGYARGRLHAGVDIGGYTPDECYAASDGVVDYIKNDPSGAEGRAIYIKRSNGWEHVYFHLQSIRVEVGQTITQGQFIGVRGGSGFGYEGLEIDGGGYSIHLHFEVHNPDGEKVDPRSILPDDNSVPIVA